MAYCRFSSLNWRCDVYAYEDCAGGFTTHVARRRVVLPVLPMFNPPVGWAVHRDRSAFTRLRFDLGCRLMLATYRLQFFMLSVMPRRDIGLPFDGETFSDGTARECADRLAGLASLGYVVPQYAIDALLEEAGQDLPS